MPPYAVVKEEGASARDSRLDYSSAEIVSAMSLVPSLTWFDRTEIAMGALLGRGGFCDVYVVKGFCSVKAWWNNASTRGFSDSTSQYVVKVPRRDHNDEQEHGSESLLCEAQIYGQLNHPHIAAIRGIVRKDNSLILDRLGDTLQERLFEWSKRMHCQARIPSRLMPRSKRRRCAFLRERLTHAMNLASAAANLHKKRIAHRDLKSSNIGFCASTGTIKIFDFGLSRQLDKRNDEFLFTLCGSPRYTAPEITGHLPYTYSCDVYSFSIVLWEMLTCERAFASHRSAEDLRRRVTEHYERPSLSHAVWRRPYLKQLVERGWQADPTNRPTMQHIHETLQQGLIET